jgi:hypothetical protein
MVMRSALHSASKVWIGHFLLMSVCGMALGVHAAYRVPVGRVLLLLPWLGVAATILSALTLLIDLLGRSDTSRVTRLLDGIDRRSVWLLLVFLPASLGASVYSSRPLVRSAFVILTVAVAAASVAAVGRRVFATGGTALAEAVRWLHYTALSVAGVFLL